MRVALVQHDVAFEDPVATCDHVAPLVQAAAGRGAELVVLTEMFATGFSMAADRVAEPATGGVGLKFLLDMAAGTGAAVCGSLPVRDNSGPRPVNRFLFAFPDGRTVGYDKVHPFSYGGEENTTRRVRRLPPSIGRGSLWRRLSATTFALLTFSGRSPPRLIVTWAWPTGPHRGTVISERWR